MGYVELAMHKIACDRKDCDAQRSVGGSGEELWESGWSFEAYFGEFKKALCPIHTKAMCEFLGISQAQYNGTEPA